MVKFLTNKFRHMFVFAKFSNIFVLKSKLMVL